MGWHINVRPDRCLHYQPSNYIPFVQDDRLLAADQFSFSRLLKSALLLARVP